MTGFPLAFLHPLALAGLIVLPVLWLILRFLPPAPKKIFLPTARFLLGLHSNRTTPDSAPWWLILLRLSILASLIFAFAAPVFNPQKPAAGSGPLNVVFDNGWASAQTWTLQVAKAEEILTRAQAANRSVQLQFTASDNENTLLRADRALERLRSAEPQSWPGDLAALKPVAAETVWISAGLTDPYFEKISGDFARNGLTIYVPDMKDRPGLVRGPAPGTENSLLRIETLSGGGERSVTAQGFDAKSKFVDQIRKTVSGRSGGEDFTDESGLFADRKIYQWKVPAFPGAGGVYLNNASRGTGLIGIVNNGKSSSTANFSDAGFYLSRATDNFAKVESGKIEDLIKKNCTVLVLPDIATVSPEDMAALEKFIESGGVILRFGGKNMSEADNDFIPVPLKTGLRSLSGDMTWTAPLKIAAFPKNSPFAGRSVPDITVERQLLAEPSADLEGRIWAALSDGTPFITAKPQGRGLLVLVHTTATPEWSDFVLSGFYVTFLREVLELSALPDKSAATNTILKPVLLLNGWGQLVKPGPDARPVSKTEIETLIPDRTHPPGYYGDSVRKFPVNLGDRLPGLEMIGALPSGAKSASLNIVSKERKLSSFFFTFAAALFLLDWLLLVFTARWNGFRNIATAMVLLLIMTPARADTDIGRAASIHLACLKTSEDKSCLAALEKISSILKTRTSVEIGSAVVVDPEKDDLSFYPLIYWPIDTGAPLTPQSRDALAAYIAKGGMVFIDTRDGAYAPGQIIASPAVAFLRAQLQGIDIPPLKPAPKDHVLFKSFYLANIYPEYDLTGKIWVEEDSIAPEEDLSSIMITGEDWIQRWAYPATKGDAEMADRFGVNLVMYALTGNYKSDQVHMKAILERMGK